VVCPWGRHSPTIHRAHRTYHGQNQPMINTRYQKTALAQLSVSTSKPGRRISWSEDRGWWMSSTVVGARRIFPKSWIYIKAKMKMAEKRRTISAATVGCITGGKFDHWSTRPNVQRTGPVSSPMGECTKCCMSMTEMIAKKVEAPRQKGR